MHSFPLSCWSLRERILYVFQGRTCCIVYFSNIISNIYIRKNETFLEKTGLDVNYQKVGWFFFFKHFFFLLVCNHIPRNVIGKRFLFFFLFLRIPLTTFIDWVLKIGTFDDIEISRYLFSSGPYWMSHGLPIYVYTCVTFLSLS